LQINVGRKSSNKPLFGIGKKLLVHELEDNLFVFAFQRGGIIKREKLLVLE